MPMSSLKKVGRFERDPDIEGGNRGEVVLPEENRLEIFKRQRDSLVMEIDKYGEDLDIVSKKYHQERLQEESEINVLRRQKGTLIKELSKYSKLLEQLKLVEESRLSSLNEFGDDRMSILNSISRAIGGTFSDYNVQLTNRNIELMRVEEFWDDAYAYFVDFQENLEAESRQNASKKASVDDQAIRLHDLEARLEETGKELADKEILTDREHQQAILIRQKIEREEKDFSLALSKTNAEITKKTTLLKKKELDLEALQITLSKQRDLLDQREIELRDREAMVARTEREFRVI